MGRYKLPSPDTTTSLHFIPSSMTFTRHSGLRLKLIVDISTWPGLMMKTMLHQMSRCDLKQKMISYSLGGGGEVTKRLHKITRREEDTPKDYIGLQGESI